MTVSTRYSFKGSSQVFTRTATYNIKIVDVTKINMPSSLNLQPGDTYTLTPQILETGATSALTWTSSNTGVALVDNNGKIRVLRVGTTDITCTAYNGVSATCKLTVVPIIAEKFALEETSCELEPGETFMLNPVFTPANTTDQSVTYKSSNTKVATVDADGLVTAVNQGKCTITASTNDGSYMSATCAVTVKPIVTSINMRNSLTLIIGEDTQLEPIIQQEGASTTLTWRSDNTSIATVSNDGTIHAAGVGTTTITCTAANGVYAECEVTVRPLPNYLYLSNSSTVIGGQVTMPVMMKNEQNITAVQFELTLPEGVSVSKNGSGKFMVEKTGRCGGHTVEASKEEGANIYTVLMYSGSVENITGSNGSILNITLEASKSIAEGNYDVCVSHINLTTPDGTKITPTDMTSTLAIRKSAPGDVNGDNEIDVTDIVGIANYILGRQGESFDIVAADVNGDNEVDVTDIVAVANIILHDGGANAANVRGAMQMLDPQ